MCAGLCAFAEAAVRFAEARPDSAVIFSTTCDQLRRGFDSAILHGHRRVFLFNLPATWQTDAAGQIFRSELQRLGGFLSGMSGRSASPERLRKELLLSSRTRQRLLDSVPASSPRGFAEAMARFHWDGVFCQPRDAESADQIPLALVGGPFLPRHWRLFEEIETSGGRVALNATEAGERSLTPAFEPGDPPALPFETLVRGYLDNIVDMFQRPNLRLYSWLRERLADRQIRGVVLWHYTGCDLWRAEARTLREVLALPVLLIEAGDEPGLAPREITRLQAFIEMLR